MLNNLITIHDVETFKYKLEIITQKIRLSITILKILISMDDPWSEGRAHFCKKAGIFLKKKLCW